MTYPQKLKLWQAITMWRHAENHRAATAQMIDEVPEEIVKAVDDAMGAVDEVVNDIERAAGNGASQLEQALDVLHDDFGTFLLVARLRDGHHSVLVCAETDEELAPLREAAQRWLDDKLPEVASEDTIAELAQTMSAINDPEGEA